MSGNGVDNFRPVFKYYKSRQPRPDLSTVLTVGADQEGVVPLSHVPQPSTFCPRCCQRAGLRPPQQWRVFALASNPGLLVIRNPFTPAGQRLWIAKCLTEYPDPPNVNNITNIVQKAQQRSIPHDGRPPGLPFDSKAIDASGGKIDSENCVSSLENMRASVDLSLPGNNPHCSSSRVICSSGTSSSPSNDDCKTELSSISSQGTDRMECAPLSLPSEDDRQALDGLPGDEESITASWWQEVLESGGVKTDTCQKLRWATLGYHHDWDTKHYSPEKHTPIPPCMANLTATLARGLAMFLSSEPQEEHQANRDQTGCQSESKGDSLTSHSSPTAVVDSFFTSSSLPQDASLLRNGSLDSPKEDSASKAPLISSVNSNNISSLFTLEASNTALSSDLVSNTQSSLSVNSNIYLSTHLDCNTSCSSAIVFSTPSAAVDITPSHCNTNNPLTQASTNITRAQLLQFRAEAAIVNYYHPGTTLSPHTDISEPNREAPLFSISFGQPCVFLVGGPWRAVPPTPIGLHSGDVVVMGGAARLAYHAVPLVTSRDQWQAAAGVTDCQQEPWRLAQDSELGGGEMEGCRGHVKKGENRTNIGGGEMEGCWGHVKKGENGKNIGGEMECCWGHVKKGENGKNIGGGEMEGCWGHVKKGENGKNISMGFGDVGNPRLERNEDRLGEDSCESKLSGCEQVCSISEADYTRTTTKSVKELSGVEKGVEEPDAGLLPRGKRSNESIKYLSALSSDDGSVKRSRIDDACSSLCPQEHFCGHQLKNDASEDELFNEGKHFSVKEQIAMLEYISANRINMNIRQVCPPGEVGLKCSNYC